MSSHKKNYEIAWSLKNAHETKPSSTTNRVSINVVLINLFSLNKPVWVLKNVKITY